MKKNANAFVTRKWEMTMWMTFIINVNHRLLQNKRKQINLRSNVYTIKYSHDVFLFTLFT